MKKAMSDNLFLYLIVTLAWTWYMGFIPFFIGLGDAPAGDVIFKLMAGPVPSFLATGHYMASFNNSIFCC